MRRTIEWIAACAVGLVLFALPFARYAFGGHHEMAGPHRDHGPRHGGHLMMLRGYHAELVQRSDSIELYLSDSTRKPLRPTSCEVTFEGHGTTPCEWSGYRSVVQRPPGTPSGLYELSTEEESTLVFKYP